MPGSSIFQFKSLSVQLAGIVVASLSPVPLGPRKRVHSWAEAAEAIVVEMAASESKWSAKHRMAKPQIQAGCFGREAPYVLILADAVTGSNEVGELPLRYAERTVRFTHLPL
jgi:hypothetical protein